MKSIACFLLLLVFAVGSSHAEELKLRSFFEGKVALKIPATFELMGEEMKKLKYPSERRPHLVYTDEEGATNVALNLLSNDVSQEQLEGFREYFVSSFKKLFPTATWKSNGLAEVNGRKVGYLELITPGIDTDIYNLLFFTDLDGKLLLCTFNCMIKDMKDQEPVAREIMHSLRIQ